MAHIYRMKKGWRAQVERAGVRDSAVRTTKAAAEAWATQREAEIMAGRRGEVIKKTLLDALRRYATDESPKRKGERWEVVRLVKFERTLPFAAKWLEDIRPAHIAAWRDDSIASGLASSSVRREMVLLRSVFGVCMREWGWLKESPMVGVTYAAHMPPRHRRVSGDEIEKITEALGLTKSGKASTSSQRVAIAFLLAIETGMRAGELASLTWSNVNEKELYAKLEKTKNGSARTVPLSKAAIALLKRLPRGGDRVVNVSSASIDALFRAARDRAGVDGLHFHDSRHEATTRLARRIEILDLARMLGHKDLKSLMAYYNPEPREIAGRLDGDVVTRKRKT